ncbi:hypothetical protein DFH07DRAFT_764025 [Mycena maculata]|uniref:Uncharacterized protein n=1 Tax=Mycena maculata TaxID=230809 RepID=A0AAD7KDQ6_9AGAR|nr:hypothetical protein DFH07DRAFT_764025 [Mycena maculata]
MALRRSHCPSPPPMFLIRISPEDGGTRAAARILKALKAFAHQHILHAAYGPAALRRDEHYGAFNLYSVDYRLISFQPMERTVLGLRQGIRGRRTKNLVYFDFVRPSWHAVQWKFHYVQEKFHYVQDNLP